MDEYSGRPKANEYTTAEVGQKMVELMTLIDRMISARTRTYLNNTDLPRIELPNRYHSMIHDAIDQTMRHLREGVERCVEYELAHIDDVSNTPYLPNHGITEGENHPDPLCRFHLMNAQLNLALLVEHISDYGAEAVTNTPCARLKSSKYYLDRYHRFC